ncbi:hypothetical protein O3P69_009107 [Scylla paramamosain]|uniref:Uncharacterized protein n=1 Tax=Scylla paramamosain TaxID=85552 RepID=A0AAW0SCE9_SCYPA
MARPNGCLHCSRREEAVTCRCLRVKGGLREARQQRRDAQQADPDLASVMRWLREGGRPGKEELSLESPATKALVQQWDSGARKRPHVVHVDHLWIALEEGHFTWDTRGPVSPPESENSSADEEAGADSVGSDAVLPAAEGVSDKDAVESDSTHHGQVKKQNNLRGKRDFRWSLELLHTAVCEHWWDDAFRLLPCVVTHTAPHLPLELLWRVCVLLYL